MKCVATIAAALVVMSQAIAGDQLIVCQSYEIPKSLWLRVPAELRADHPDLLKKVKGAVPSGKAELRSRLSKRVFSGSRAKVGDYVQQPYPTDLTLNEGDFVPVGMEIRNVGTVFESDGVEYGRNFSYFLDQCEFLGWVPCLSRGKSLNKDRSEFPRFLEAVGKGELDLSSGDPVLVSALPAHSASEERVLLTFMTLMKSESSVSDHAKGNVTIEFLVVKGEEGRKPLNEQTMGLLAKIQESVAANFEVTVLAQRGRRLSWQSGVATIHATQCSLWGGGVHVPGGFSMHFDGTLADVHVTSESQDSLGLEYTLQHDVDSSVLPVAPGDNGRMDAVKRFTIEEKDAVDLPFGKWVYQGGVDLKTPLPAKHPDAETQYHLYVKAVRVGASS